MGIYAMTGGATGIGAAIKNTLRDAGHQVIVVDIKNADIEADLSTEEGRNAAVDGIRAAAPDGLDGFIPVAGVGPHVSPPSLVARINYFGTVRVTQALVDDVAKRKGAIVMISSNSAQIQAYNQDFLDACWADDEAKAVEIVDALDGQEAYGGSKYGITVWMRKMSTELAGRGVRINAVAPGYTETPLTQNDALGDFKEAIDAFRDSIPIGRAGLPQDMANAVEFLLSEKSSFVVGSCLYVDGGHDAIFRPNAF